jgi:hypothetical protein
MSQSSASFFSIADHVYRNCEWDKEAVRREMNGEK